MTKKLSELFDLPYDDATVNEDLIEKSQVTEITTDALSNLEKIEKALTQVSGLTEADNELDELAATAIASFKELQDLGMQVDSRFASEIFGVAGTMLGHAITAKTAKINKKLKMIDLQLKKAQLDQKAMSQTKELENTPVGEGSLVDRNELLRQILANKKSD